MKRKIITGILLVLLAAGGFTAWKIFGPSVHQPAGKYFYIKTGSSYASVKRNLLDEHIIDGVFFFDFMAHRLGYDESVKAGRYEIRKGMSLIALIRMLRSGDQSEVKLVINKWRTVDDMIGQLAKNFESDATALRSYFDNPDSMAALNLDSNTIMTAVIPNTYGLFWNSPPWRIFRKLYREQDKFWTPERKQKASALNLTPKQAYILASIVEEETNEDADKGKIASVYLNRMETGMKLGADPTVKFALKDFGLKRIFNKHLSVESPYNTYMHTGLPPGPICTPSAKTIDAVLNAPITDYLYFVAQPNLTGYSNFASNYTQHMQYAREYQVWIDSFLRAKAAKQP